MITAYLNGEVSRVIGNDRNGRYSYSNIEGIAGTAVGRGCDSIDNCSCADTIGAGKYLADRISRTCDRPVYIGIALHYPREICARNIIRVCNRNCGRLPRTNQLITGSDVWFRADGHDIIDGRARTSGDIRRDGIRYRRRRIGQTYWCILNSPGSRCGNSCQGARYAGYPVIACSRNVGRRNEVELLLTANSDDEIGLRRRNDRRWIDCNEDV